MNSLWQAHLSAAGATYDGRHISRFGDPQQALRDTHDKTIITDLTGSGLLHITGDDAENFLQGQLSSDIQEITAGNAQYSSYNTPKGRMLATFLAWWDDDGYCLQLPYSLLESVKKRLSLFIMRAKVEIEDASDRTVRIGVAGERATALLAKAFGELPADAMNVVHNTSGNLICLNTQQYLFAGNAEQAIALWSALRHEATPVGISCWEWLNIRAGIPQILPSTQEAFVPQMANLELIGGVSFKKGCYTGQEIITRTQHLGKIKRRLYLAHIDTNDTPQPGDPLFDREAEGQSSGKIINAQQAPSGGYDVLAVIPVASVNTGGSIHWYNIDGPVLNIHPLPYSVT